MFDPTQPVEFISVGKVDYDLLEKLLAREQWKEADSETAQRMLEVMGREKEGWLRVEDIDCFPCEDLRKIDKLWFKYSKAHFGFSVQKRIYKSLWGTQKYHQKTWEAFGDRVGWRVQNEWLWYDDLKFVWEVPRGYLPAWGIGSGLGGGWGGWRGRLLYRVETCGL